MLKNNTGCPSCRKSIFSSKREKLVAFPGLLERGLNLVAIARQQGRLFLEQYPVVVEGCGDLVFLHQFLRHLKPQRGILGPQGDDLGQLGRRLFTLARGLIIVRQRLVKLNRVGRLLELLDGCAR